MSLLIPTRAITNANANYPQGYHRGNVGGLQAVEPNLIPPNIKYGVTEFGILGEMVQWIYDLSFPKLAKLVIPTPSLALVVAEDHSGGGHIAEKTLSIAEPAILVPTTDLYSPVALDGAIADDGGAQTDETTEANNATANDMTLLPAVPEVDDAYYFGLLSLWDWLSLLIGQAGAGTWTIVWEYWNGSTFASLLNVLDTSNGFRNGGYQSVSFDRPDDWETSSIMLADLYWIRARVTAYTSITTQPLGTQAWIGTH